MSKAKAVPPGAVIGILGGGQLGRMLALAAARLGLRTHVYAPEEDSPAFAVAHAHTRAAWDDAAALSRFAENVDVVTYEFENVPLQAVALLARMRPVRPGERALAVAQDRWREKTFAAGLGITTPPFANIETEGDLAAAARAVPLPAVLKTRRFGYDGKGQVMLRPGDDLAMAWNTLGRVPCLLEGFVDFACEASVLVARGMDGVVVAYDVPRNEHERHVLRRSHVPSGLAPRTELRAVEIGRTLASSLDHVGVLAVELFVVRQADGTETLVFNEMAPRVHNSGHWTEAACDMSQFEAHVRAICGWPLWPPERHHDCVMTNILGHEAKEWMRWAAEPGVVLHLYGKGTIREGRKMGHVTRLLPSHGAKTRQA